MAFLPIAAGLLGLGGSIIGADAAKNQANQQAQQQQQLEQQAYQQQLQYTNAANAATRQAFLGLAQQGNPYLQAGSQVAKPQMLPGGQFGPSPSAAQPAQSPQQMVQANPGPSPVMQQSFVRGAQPPQRMMPQAAGAGQPGMRYGQ